MPRKALKALTEMGRKKKPERELPEEVPVVIECSPNLTPCKKFLHANRRLKHGY